MLERNCVQFNFLMPDLTGAVLANQTRLIFLVEEMPYLANFLHPLYWQIKAAIPLKEPLRGLAEGEE